MNQQQLDTIVQAAVGIVALIIMAFFVHQGQLSASEVVPIAGIILSAFGFAEVGRRQEKKKYRDR